MLPVGFASVATSASLSECPIPSPPSTSLKHLPASNLNRGLNTSEEKYAALDRCLSRTIRCCPCGRRHFFGASAAAAVLSPLFHVKTGNSLALDANGSTDKFRSARPDWYEELFAKAMEEGMRSYEAEVAGYKADLFSSFTGTCKEVLELGVGTGPNFKYYAHDDLHVVGVDPNKQMEKYAQGAALAAGLLPMSFTFMQGVGEDLPVEDGSMDAVVGTLVLCTVNDVNLTLQEVKRVLKAGGLYLFIEHVAAPDGSLLRFTQSILDPLQQLVADGCHLTRETGGCSAGGELTTYFLVSLSRRLFGWRWIDMIFVEMLISGIGLSSTSICQKDVIFTRVSLYDPPYFLTTLQTLLLVRISQIG